MVRWYLCGAVGFVGVVDEAHLAALDGGVDYEVAVEPKEVAVEVAVVHLSASLRLVVRDHFSPVLAYELARAEGLRRKDAPASHFRHPWRRIGNTVL